MHKSITVSAREVHTINNKIIQSFSFHCSKCTHSWGKVFSRFTHSCGGRVFVCKIGTKHLEEHV